MKYASCYNCRSDEYVDYAEENGYWLVRCKKCGLLFVRNQPDSEQTQLATKVGIHHGDKDLRVTGRYHRSSIQRYIGVLHDLYRDDPGSIKTWLDVGCGHGEFMEAVIKFSAASIDIKGIEPNVLKMESARSRNLDVNDFDLNVHKRKYDAISLLDVYSHLPDPPAFLSSLTRLLNPSGEIVLQTGDSSKYTAEEYPKPFCLPDHLSFASEQIVVSILRRLNYEIIAINKYPYYYRELKVIAKELVKLIVPKCKSNIKYYLEWKKYSGMNMYIRARMRSI